MMSYKESLFKGKNVKKEGLIWIIKAIRNLGEDVPLSYMPEFLDSEFIEFLFKLFKKQNSLDNLIKKLLIEIGFPVKKEENNEKSKLEEMLKEKIKNNIEERKFIVNQYNKHNVVVKLIKQKEEKIDELTSSLANLIDAESEQKMREEEYKNELKQIANNLYNDNNNFNNPREGY